MKNEHILTPSVFALVALLHIGLMSLLWQSAKPAQVTVQHIEFVDLSDLGSGGGQPESAPAPPPPPPPPARSESNGYAIHWQRPVARAADDQGEAVTQGWRRGVRLVVTSSGGIGQVEVRPTRGGWPNQVQVEFRYAPDRPFDALEGMRFQVINPAHTAGDEVPPLVPDNFVFWQRDGRFWLDLPSGWLRGQQGLRIAWVDRYRR